ncbi:hypothetical protein ACHAW6_013395 [Cyclotella cf. meneghiniana]
MRFKHEKIIKVKAPKSGSERLELVLDPNWILTPDFGDDRNDREGEDWHPEIAQSASNHSNHSASTTETDNRSCTRVNRTFSLESDGSASRTDFENDVYAEMERRGELYQEGEEDYYSMDKPKQNPVENYDDDEYYAGLENDVSALQNSLSEESEKFDAADNAVDDNVEPYDEEPDVNANRDCDLQYHVNNGACLIKDAAVSDEILTKDSLDLEGPDDEQDLQEHHMITSMSRDFDDDDHEMLCAVSQDFDDDPTDIGLEYDQPLNDNRDYNKEPPRRGVSFDEDFLSSGESNRSPVARTTPLRRMQSDDTSVSSVGYRVVTTASKEKMEPIQIRTRTTSPSILRQPKYTSNVSVSSNGNAINHVQSPKPTKNTREQVKKEQKMNEPVIQSASNSVFSSQSAKRTNVRGERRVSSPTDDSITTPSGVSGVQSHGSNSAIGLLARSKQKTASSQMFAAKPPPQQRHQQEQQQRPQRPPPKPRQNQQTHDLQPRAQIGVRPHGFSLGQQTIPSIARSHSGLSVYSEGVRSTAALDGYVEEQPRGKRFSLSRPKKPTRTNASTVNVTTLVSKKTRLVTKLFRLKKKTAFAAEEERGDNFSTMMRHPMSPEDPNPERSLQTNEREPPVPSVLYRRSKSSQRIGMPTATSENDNASIASETSAFSYHSTTHRSRQSNLSHVLPRSPPPNQQQPPSSFNNDNRQVLRRSTSGVDDNPWSNTAPEEAASVKDRSPEDSSDIDIPPNDSLSTVTQIASMPNNQAENPKKPPAETANLPNDSVPNTNPPDGSYNMDGSGMPAFKWWTWSQPDDKREQGKESRYCALMCVFPPATE